MATLITLLILVLGFAAWLAGVALINGFVLSTFWSWFVVPIFGLPGLTVVQAIGIGMIVSWLTYRGGGDKKDENPLKLLGDPLWRAAVALFVGWIVHLFL